MWFIAQVVTAQIDSDDLEAGGQCDHLVAPGIPEVGEAMDHDDQWSFATSCVVDVYSVIVGIMICHVLVDIDGYNGGCHVLHFSFLSHLSLYE